jgi:uncharacterized protein
MASRNSSKSGSRQSKPTASRSAKSTHAAALQADSQQPLVSGRWLLGAVAGVVVLAAICAYLTLCLLFYQGQWQIVFHPSRSVTSTPAAAGLKFDAISFDYTGTGAAQLSGWWIPADPGAANSHTILFLRDGKGALSDDVSQLQALHSLGVNVFAFDYRGFGQSMNTHPSEERVYDDADAAWNYLTDIRHIDPRSILLYGKGLGAIVATETAIRHSASPALVLENPAPPALSLIGADERTSLLPIRWLFRDRFEIGPRLAKLNIELGHPASEMAVDGKQPPATEIVRQEKLSAAGPRFLLFLGPDPEKDIHYLPTLREFIALL